MKSLLLFVLSMCSNRVVLGHALWSTLQGKHNQCQEDAMKLCPEGIPTFEANLQYSLPIQFKELRKLTNDQVTFPALSFDAHTDLCLWTAFLNKKINNELCIEMLKEKISRLDKTIHQGNRAPVFIDLTFFFWGSQNEENHYSTYAMYYREHFHLHLLAFLLHQFALGQYLYRGIDNMFLKIFMVIFSLFASLLLSLLVPTASIVVGCVDLLLIWYFEEVEEDGNHDEDKAYSEDFAYVAIPIQIV